MVCGNARIPMEFEWLGIPCCEASHFLIAALLVHPPPFNVVSVLLYIPIVFTACSCTDGSRARGTTLWRAALIELNGWGGLTHWLEGREFSRGRSIFVSFAVPLVGNRDWRIAFAVNMVCHQRPRLGARHPGDITFVTSAVPSST